MAADVLIRNGRIIDPAQGIDATGDVAIADGRVAQVGGDLSGYEAGRLLDAAGCLVVPGLIDLHTHCYWGGTGLSIEADTHLASGGATTWVDAGTAGAANFAGFRRFLIERSRTRIVPYLNVSTPGIVADGVHENVKHLNADAAYATVEKNRDIIKGIKVLSSGLQVGQNDLTPLRVGREVAEAVGLPLMCHIGVPPPGLWAILPIMRRGDIITHTYKGRRGCLVIAGNLVRPEAWEARSRGVLFDIGHGSGSFAWEVAHAAMEQGFPPDTISTDVHKGSIDGPAFSMPSVMSKFLHLGMALPEVIKRSTLRPAEILGMADEIGTLRPGACGDVTVLRLEQGEFPLKDCEGVTEMLSQRLTVVATVRAGEVV